MNYAAEQLWDALRDVACTTGRKAKRVVMVTPEDIEKAVALVEQRAEAQRTKDEHDEAMAE